MPRNASGVFNYPSGTAPAAGELVDADKQNQRWDDLQSDANAARPISAGGTGATTAAAARTNLGVGSDVYRKSNILGTVSQSSGVPTGSVIQRGSGPNGEYVRFADGTQICTVSGLSSSAAATSTWTFPASFNYPANPGRPAVSGMVGTTVADPCFLQFGGLSSGNDITFDTINLSGSRVAKTVHLMAIGRWF